MNAIENINRPEFVPCHACDKPVPEGRRFERSFRGRVVTLCTSCAEQEDENPSSSYTLVPIVTVAPNAPGLLVEAIEAAQGRWTGWDWAQDFGVPGQDRVVIDGPPSKEALATLPAETRAEVEEYAARVEADAALAEHAAAEALSALVSDDLRGAIEALTAAEAYERAYGDSPTWGVPLELAEEIRDELEDAAGDEAEAERLAGVEEQEQEWRDGLDEGEEQARHEALVEVRLTGDELVEDEEDET